MKARSLTMLGVVFVLNLIAFRGLGPLDDDFIFYRYAQGILERGEIAYNVGERVEGFVAPLWLACITLGTALGLAPDFVSVGLGVLGAGGAVLFSAFLWWRRCPARFPYPVLLLASLPALGFHAWSGLGTTALALCLSLFAWSWERALAQGRRGVVAGLWLAAACLLRPEALVFLLPFGVLELRRRRVAALVAAASPVALWSVFRLLYFGTLLPHPFHMKRLGWREDLAYGADYLWGATREVGAGLWCLVLLCALGASAWSARRRAMEGPSPRAGTTLGRDPFFLALTAGVLLHAVSVIAVGGDYMRFSRLFLPVLPVTLVLVGEGLVAAHGNARSARARRAWIGVGLLLFLAPQASQHMRRGAVDLYTDQELRWRTVGRRLAQITEPEHHIALSPVGCMGYESGRPIVDMLGLTHAALLDVVPDLRVTLKAHHRFDAEWVLSEDPELVVPSNGSLRLEAQFYLLWERDLLVHPRFAERYRAIRVPVPESYPLILYLRRDLALPTGATEIPGAG